MSATYIARKLVNRCFLSLLRQQTFMTHPTAPTQVSTISFTYIYRVRVHTHTQYMYTMYTPVVCADFFFVVVIYNFLICIALCYWSCVHRPPMYSVDSAKYDVCSPVSCGPPTHAIGFGYDPEDVCTDQKRTS